MILESLKNPENLQILKSLENFKSLKSLENLEGPEPLDAENLDVANEAA